MARSMSSELMGLSLFVMMLAFFIVLNAISSYEESKLRPVMNSLDSAFTIHSAAEQQNAGTSVTQSEDASVNEGSALERIRALFTSQIPGHKTILNQRRGVMQVEILFADFEEAVMTLDQQDQGDEKAKDVKKLFLPMLVALMKTQAAGMSYRMDIVLNIGENPAEMQNRQPQQLAALMKRMAAIAQKIEAAGLPVKLISIGTQKGEEGTVELLFRPHAPFNPAGAADGDGQQQQ